MSLEGALEIVCLTDPGKVRAHNEDAVARVDDPGLVVLADGMGGYKAGEVASGMTTDSISAGLARAWRESEGDMLALREARLLAHRLVVEQIDRANAAVYERAQTDPNCQGMGTTLVMGFFYANTVTVAHIGDSRMYRLRGETLEQITRDHSLLQEQIDSGLITPEQAKYSLNKNLVTRALGVDPTVEPELNSFDVQTDDIYLLCSDGLNDMVDDEEIGLTLTSLRANLGLAAGQLVQSANDNGGRDNISVVLVRVLRDFASSQGLITKLRGWLTR